MYKAYEPLYRHIHYMNEKKKKGEAISPLARNVRYMHPIYMIKSYVRALISSFLC
jgi:hypothetical protein